MLENHTPLTILCLCAQWCVICREFEPQFRHLRDAQPEHHWRWIDIEDHDAVLSDLDIQNFPTIVILDGAGEMCFAGTIEPRMDMLQRLVRSAQDGQLRLTPTEAAHWQAVKALPLPPGA
jgi:thioredoxin-like negative regulator of GroEL